MKRKKDVTNQFPEGVLCTCLLADHLKPVQMWGLFLLSYYHTTWMFTLNKQTTIRFTGDHNITNPLKVRTCFISSSASERCFCLHRGWETLRQWTLELQFSLSEDENAEMDVRRRNCSPGLGEKQLVQFLSWVEDSGTVLNTKLQCYYVSVRCFTTLLFSSDVSNREHWQHHSTQRTVLMIHISFHHQIQANTNLCSCLMELFLLYRIMSTFQMWPSDTTNIHQRKYILVI